MNVESFISSLKSNVEMSILRSDLNKIAPLTVMTISRDIQTFCMIESTPGAYVNFVINDDDYDMTQPDSDVVRAVYLDDYDDATEATSMLMMQFLVDQFDDCRKTHEFIAKRIASFRHIILRDDAYTLAQAAKALDCSVKTVKNLCAKSILLRTSDDYDFITKASVEAYASQRTMQRKRKTNAEHAAINAAINS